MRHLVVLLTTTLLFTRCGFITIKGVRPKGLSAFTPSWIRNNDPLYETGNLPIALHSPLIFRGLLYSGHNDGHMMAYELKNGRLVWKKYDGGQYHGTPMVYKDFIIYGTTDGQVYARHYLTGEVKFRVDLDASVESEGVVSKGRLFFHLRNHKIFCLDVETGKIFWSYKRSIPYLSTLQRVSRPLIKGNRLYVGMADGYVAAFSVEDGQLLWETKVTSGHKFVDVDTSPVLKGNHLLMGPLSGPLTILNPTTGKILRRLDGHHVSRAPLIEKDRIFLGTRDGRLVHLNPYFKLVKEKKLSQGVITSILPWKKKLVVSTVAGELFLVDPVDFSLLEKKHLGHANSAVFGQMRVGEGSLALISSRNRLYVFH